MTVWPLWTWQTDHCGHDRLITVNMADWPLWPWHTTVDMTNSQLTWQTDHCGHDRLTTVDTTYWPLCTWQTHHHGHDSLTNYHCEHDRLTSEAMIIVNMTNSPQWTWQDWPLWTWHNRLTSDYCECYRQTTVDLTDWPLWTWQTDHFAQDLLSTDRWCFHLWWGGRSVRRCPRCRSARHHWLVGPSPWPATARAPPSPDQAEHTKEKTARWTYIRSAQIHWTQRFCFTI